MTGLSPPLSATPASARGPPGTQRESDDIGSGTRGLAKGLERSVMEERSAKGQTRTVTTCVKSFSSVEVSEGRGGGDEVLLSHLQ